METEQQAAPVPVLRHVGDPHNYRTRPEREAMARSLSSIARDGVARGAQILPTVRGRIPAVKGLLVWRGGGGFPAWSSVPPCRVAGPDGPRAFSL